MEDEQVGEFAPRALRESLHKRLLNLRNRVVGLCKAESLGEAFDVGIDNDADVDVEGVAEDDVCGLAGDAAQREELVHRGGNLTSEAFDDGLHRFVNGAGFISEQADGLDEGLDLLGSCSGVVGWRWETGKESGRGLVDADIGGLGGEDGCDQEFVGRGVDELAVRIGIVIAEGGEESEIAILGFGGHDSAFDGAAAEV